MITCFSKKTHFDTWFTNGKHEGHCDAPGEKGGCDAGFGPHELLEAALASCLNIYVRVCAQKQNIPLAGVVTEVTLERHTPEEVVFRYGLELKKRSADGRAALAVNSGRPIVSRASNPGRENLIYLPARIMAMEPHNLRR